MTDQEQFEDKGHALIKVGTPATGGEVRVWIPMDVFLEKDTTQRLDNYVDRAAKVHLALKTKVGK